MAGSTLGVTICSATFRNVLLIRFQRRLEDADAAEDIIKHVNESFGAIPSVDPAIRPRVEESFMVGVQAVFLHTLIKIVPALASSLV